MAWELIVFVLTMMAVSVGCLLPAGCLPPLPNDKLLHFGAFAVLTTLAVQLAPAWQQQRYWLGGLLLAGLAIEVGQKFVPGRNFCWRDMAANAAGIASTACAASLIRAF